MVTDRTTRLPMGLHQQLDAVAAVAIRTLPDLCLGIVSERLEAFPLGHSPLLETT